MLSHNLLIFYNFNKNLPSVLTINIFNYVPTTQKSLSCSVSNCSDLISHSCENSVWCQSSSWGAVSHGSERLTPCGGGTGNVGWPSWAYTPRPWTHATPPCSRVELQNLVLRKYTRQLIAISVEPAQTPGSALRNTLKSIINTNFTSEVLDYLTAMFWSSNMESPLIKYKGLGDKTSRVVLEVGLERELSG